MMMVVLKKMNFMLDAVDGTYAGYANPEFYLRGYAAYYELEVAVSFMEVFKKREADRNYEIIFFYDPDNDCFVYEDIENYGDTEYWYGQEVLTEDGQKHLYPVGEGWWWEAAQ